MNNGVNSCGLTKKTLNFKSENNCVVNLARIWSANVGGMEKPILAYITAANIWFKMRSANMLRSY